MLALDHVSITVRDLDRVGPFYDALFAALEIAKVDDRFSQRSGRKRCEDGVSSWRR
jgi:catechol 2,3-dioxygenase-like lactoylglutathione lyase family enzyme